MFKRTTLLLSLFMFLTLGAFGDEPIPPRPPCWPNQIETNDSVVLVQMDKECFCKEGISSHRRQINPKNTCGYPA